MKLIFLFFSFLLLASAHNWIHGASRAPKASQQIPAPARQEKRSPHRQVGAGQDFVIEWVNGHPGSYYYFITLKSVDEAKLALHSEALLNKYIAEAPESAYIYQDDRYQKMHISCTHKYPKQPAGRGDCPSTAYNSGSKYERIVTPADPFYIDRSPWHPNPGSDMTHFKYSAAAIAMDKRVAYYNEKYPWIEAVHKIRVQVKFPKEWDAARFSIPARQGSGEYMVHMVWRGYRDVIDIDVLPEPANDIYGKSGADKRWIKTEHCQYPNYKNHRKSRCFYLQPGDTVDKCMNDCIKRGTRNCKALNVVPLFTPDAVKIQGKRPIDSQIPWLGKGMSKFCRHDRLPNTVNEDTMVCYGFIPGKPTDPAFNPETENYWYVRETDPEDPVFYSSCYRLEVKRNFVGNVPCPKCEDSPKSQEVNWHVGDRCLDCDQIKKSEGNSVEQVEFWKTSKLCDKCF